MITTGPLGLKETFLQDIKYHCFSLSMLHKAVSGFWFFVSCLLEYGLNYLLHFYLGQSMSIGYRVLLVASIFLNLNTYVTLNVAD
jgi:hypothetical protein